MFLISVTEPTTPARLTVMPSSLTAVSLSLTWQEGVGDFDQYELSYRMIGSEISTTLGRLDKSTTFYSIDGLDPGTAYVFKVSAISGTGETATISSPRVLTVTTGNNTKTGCKQNCHSCKFNSDQKW